MLNSIRYPFISGDTTFGEASFRPFVPLTLHYQEQSIVTSGLLDTGARVNVLPYRAGLELGAVWEQQTTPLNLTGDLAQAEARLLLVSASVASFPVVRLAWTSAENVPLNTRASQFLYGVQRLLLSIRATD
jgi:hypothetical protein